MLKRNFVQTSRGRNVRSLEWHGNRRGGGGNADRGSAVAESQKNVRGRRDWVKKGRRGCRDEEGDKVGGGRETAVLRMVGEFSRVWREKHMQRGVHRGGDELKHLCWGVGTEQR